MRRPSRLTVVLLVSWNLFIVLPPVRAAAPAGESERLRRLFDLAWEEKLLATPEFATYTGFPGHNDRWSDFSQDGIERRHAARREQLKSLLSIDRGRLTAAEQVDFDLFRRRLEGQIEGFSFRRDLRHGAVPLDLLEQNIKAWVAGVKAAPTPKAPG